MPTAIINFIRSSITVAIFAFMILDPFKNLYRFNRLVTFFLTLFYIIMTGAITAVFLTPSSILANYFSLGITLWFVLACGLMILSVKGRFAQLIFVIFMALNIYSNISAISVVIMRIFKLPIFMEHFGAIINLFVVLLYLPFLYYLFVKLYGKIVGAELYLTFWNYIWLIPAFSFMIYVTTIKEVIWVRSENVTLRLIVFTLLWGIMIYLVFCVILNMLIQIYNNLKAKELANFAEKQLLIQKEQYKRLFENINTTERMRHDFRHHLLTISGLAQNGELERLRDYLEEYKNVRYISCDMIYCENVTVNNILGYYNYLAFESGILTDIKIEVPENLPVSDLDLCVLFGNLIENAVEACERQLEGEKFIKLSAKVFENHFILTIQNSYQKQKDGFSHSISTKTGQHGIGLSSVKILAERNDGLFRVSVSENIFTVNILLNFDNQYIDRQLIR